MHWNSKLFILQKTEIVDTCGAVIFKWAIPIVLDTIIIIDETSQTQLVHVLFI
jgi:hypothetical protein